MNNKSNTATKGQYKIAIVEAATGKTVWEMPDWKPNMILTRGMDKKADLPWEDLFTYSCAGAGTTSNYISGGASTWQIYQMDVYSDSAEYVDLMAGSIVPGDTLVVSPTQEFPIRAIFSGTSYGVDPRFYFVSYAMSPVSFGKTSRTALDSELKRTNTWYTGWPYCGTVINGATVSMRRTFDFGVELAQTTYGEVGFSWSDNPAEGLFSRVVLPETVTVDAGYYLRAFYELQVTYSPSDLSYVTFPVSPFTSSGQQRIQSFAGTCTSYVASSGSSAGTPLLEGLDKIASPEMFISDSYALFNDFGTNYPPTENGSFQYSERPTVKDPYREGSFYLTRTATWEPGAFVGNAWLWGLVGSNNYNWNTYFMACQMAYDTLEAYVPKVAADEQVQFSWAFSWSRAFYDTP